MITVELTQHQAAALVHAAQNLERALEDDWVEARRRESVTSGPRLEAELASVRMARGKISDALP